MGISNKLTRRFAGALLLAAALSLPALADVTITAGADEATGEASVGIGQHLIVRLPLAGGTGYSWKLADDGAPELALSGQRMERAAQRLGAPQVAVFDFEAQAAGAKTLNFDFVGPGESEPTKSYVLSVTVSE